MSSPTKEVRKAYYYRNREKILIKSKEIYVANKETLIEYQKEYRKKNLNKISAKQKQVRNTKLDILIEMLGNKCAHCEISYPRCVYDFHHINPEEKEYGIGSYMGNSLKKLKIEAQKCILLCANCHRKVHSDSESI